MKNTIIKLVILCIVLFIVPDIVMLLPVPNKILSSLWQDILYYFLKIVFVDIGILWLFKELIKKSE